MKNKLAIIAGEWRHRQLLLAEIAELRPTPARVRETLFNWLQHEVIASRCLDLYAGSGALGFEAASRGAKSVVMVEYNPHVCRLIKENCTRLVANQVKIIQSEVFSYLSTDSSPFDLVFLDPPFAKNRVQKTCQYLEHNGWLMPDAKVYIEVEKQLKLADMPANWHCLKHKKAGEVGYYLFKRNSDGFE